MDYNNITINSTSEVRAYCDTLDAGVEYYRNLVSELTNAKTEILNNWNGNTSDILDVTVKIDNMVADFEKLIPGMSELSSALRDLADETDRISQGTPSTPIGNGGNGGNGGETPVPEPGNTEVKEEKPGFWQYHGGNFADAWTGQDWGGAWDYSGCDAGLDYIGATVDGIFDTVGNLGDALWDTGGAIVNFGADCVSEFLGWFVG